MSYYAFSALLNAIVALVLGIIVFVRNRKEQAHLGFSLFSGSVFIWSFSYFIWQISTTETAALFWCRLLTIGVIFTAVTYLHFVYGVLEIFNKKFKFLILSYVLFGIFSLISFSPLLVAKVESILSFKYWPMAGPLYSFLLLLWLLYVIYVAVILIIEHKKATGIKKLQIKYVMLGTIIGFGGGATNYFLWYKILILPIGNIFASFGLIIFSYSIFRYGMMNIKVIAAELLAFGLTAFAFVQIFLPLEIDETGKLIVKLAFVAGVVAIGWMLIKSTLKVLKNQKLLAELSDQLNVANVKLKALEQAKTEFISIASHQLRTPLSFIKGTTSMALEGIWQPFNETQNTELKKIYIFNERLVKLVDELLDISRIDSNRLEFNFETVSLEPLIEEIVKDFESEANIKKISLLYQKPQTALPQVKIDVWKIRQVITNLIDNALRYTNKGGITIGAKEENNKVVAWVQDSGIGVSPQQQKLIFERFGRDKEVIKVHSEGMGLGLYLGTQLVKAHKGRLWVESKPGQGSTFYLELPALN